MDVTVTYWAELEELEATGEVELEGTFQVGEAWRRGDAGPELDSLGVYVVATGQRVSDSEVIERMAELAEESARDTLRERPQDFCE